MSDKTVAELMALHHVAARKHAEWCMCGGPDEKKKAHESLQADVALEQAIRRAVDWGEPVAYADWLVGKEYHKRLHWIKVVGDPDGKAWISEFRWEYLYARRQDQ